MSTCEPAKKEVTKQALQQKLHLFSIRIVISYTKCKWGRACIVMSKFIFHHWVKSHLTVSTPASALELVHYFRVEMTSLTKSYVQNKHSCYFFSHLYFGKQESPMWNCLKGRRFAKFKPESVSTQSGLQ